jgi:hypothetical protein
MNLHNVLTDNFIHVSLGVAGLPIYQGIDTILVVFTPDLLLGNPLLFD